MKRIAILLAFLASSVTVMFAQNLSVKGQIYDYDSADPLISAAVQIFQISGNDSTYIGGASTDEDGSFVINNLKAGNYRARVSFVGYDDAVKNFTIRSGTATTDLGKINMRAGQMLEEVAINAVVAKVQMINDTVMFNSAAYKLPEGASVEDLVRKLPGVQISSDGTITVNGKEVTKILVNGKEFFSDDKTVALTQLTADMIEKVKAYDKQSDLARQTGIDDGDEQTVLDLQVKKGMAKGWFGNLSVGGGAPLEKEGFDVAALYSVNATINRFDEDKQFTITGGASQSSGGMSGGMGMMRMGGGIGGGFGGFGGGMGGFAGCGGGVNTSYNGGASFAMDLGEETSQDNYEWEVGGSVNWSHSDNTGSSNTFNQNFTFNQYNSQAGTNGSGSDNLSANMRIEWNKSLYTSLLFTPSFSYSKSDNWRMNNSAQFDQNPYMFTSTPLDTVKATSGFYTKSNYPFDEFPDVDPESTMLDSLYDYYNKAMQNYISSSSNNNSKSISASGNLQFVRRFGNRGRNISVSGTYNISKSEGDNLSHESSYYPKLPAAMQNKIKNQYTDSPSDQNSFNAQLTYSEPISTGTYLQFSYRFNYSERIQDRSTYNLQTLYDAYWGVPVVDGTFDDINWDFDKNNTVKDENQSSKQFNYNYDQNIQFQFRKNATDQSYNFTAGITLMPQYVKQNYSGHGIKDTVLTRNVMNFNPTLQFRYRITSQEQFNISLSSRSTQPNMSDLLPILDTLRITSASNGNPTLVPYYNNQFRIEYRKYNPVSMSSVNVNASFSNTLRNITTKQWKVNDNKGTQLSQPMNMEGFWSNWNGSLGLTASITFPDDRFSLSSTTNGQFRHQEGLTSTATDLDAAVAVANKQIFDDYTDPNERRSITNSITGTENLQFEYRDDYLTASLSGTFRYNHSDNNLSNQSTSFGNNMGNSGIKDTYDFSYGTNIIAFIPWRNMRLATDLNMSSRRGYAGKEANTDELIWNVSASFSFLKGNKASLQVALYDLLHQRSNMNYSVSATSATQSQNTNITSYFMATLTYRLSVMGDRNSRQQLRGRGGFGGGMGGFGGGMGGGMMF